jgi:hypothetical protein
MSTRLEELAAHRAVLSAASAAVSAELRRENRNARARAHTVARQWVLPENVRKVALIMSDIAQGDTEPAVKYLTGVAKQQRWPSRSIEELERVVEDLFLDATSTDAQLELYAGLTDVSQPTDVAAMSIAARQVASWRVVQWSRAQNRVQGLAPSTDQMLLRAESERERFPEELGLPQRGTSREGSARRWAHRLRVQYNGRSGKLRVREVLPPEEMRDKALILRLAERTVCHPSHV